MKWNWNESFEKMFECWFRVSLKMKNVVVCCCCGIRVASFLFWLFDSLEFSIVCVLLLLLFDPMM